MEDNLNENNDNNKEEKQNVQQEMPPRQQFPQVEPQRKPARKHSSIIPILAVLAVVLLLFGSVFSFMLRLFSGSFFGGAASGGNDDSLRFSSPYIAQLNVEGVIQSSGSGSSVFGVDEGYHHTWTVNKIKQLKEDQNNRGLLLFVNSPGGGVYESDELYFALKDYKETTGRPVYSYMASQAASGGYYISAPADKIFANRNCWTGSIGVTLGTFYDVTGLLKKYGVKTVTIDSGANKSMGSYTVEMTDEQKEILQGLVDEAYDQFVGIVSEGRHMDRKEVKKLADGRIYTAKQAKENGLIDEVGTYDEAVSNMKKTYELDGCQVQKLEYKEKDSILKELLRSASELRGSSVDSDLDALKALMDENGKFSVTYLAAIDR